MYNLHWAASLELDPLQSQALYEQQPQGGHLASWQSSHTTPAPSDASFPLSQLSHCKEFHRPRPTCHNPSRTSKRVADGFLNSIRAIFLSVRQLPMVLSVLKLAR
uniref:Uncharacterized protein n=1 Tax=Sphaerodactylus townsendi TaxID=933632 RepID=A0ACB8F2S4_9SAUR